MSHSKLKNYILYTYSYSYDYQKRVFCLNCNREDFTREQLVRKIAIGIAYEYKYPIPDFLIEEEPDIKELETKLMYWSGIDYNKYYYIKKYKNDEYEVVDLSGLKKDIDIKVKEYQDDRNKKRERYRSRHRKRYTFRCGSVPGTGVARYKFCNYYRSPKIHGILIEADVPEYRNFRKADERKENMPEWDDRPRHIDRSWKTSTKCNKQWEKHVSKHVDSIRINKHQYDIYEIEDTYEINDVA